MSFDDAAVRTLYSQIVSHCATLGLFDRIATHEPKNAPGNGLNASVWVQEIIPLPRAGGLSATTGKVTFNIRIQTNMLKEPQDDIDREMLSAATVLLNEYSGNFTLGGSVRNVDLLGSFGTPLSAQAGYIQQDNRMYRVMVVTLPIVINDLWTQNG